MDFSCLTKTRLIARLVAAASILTSLTAALIAGLNGLTLSPEMYAFVGAIVGAGSAFLYAKD